MGASTSTRDYEELRSQLEVVDPEEEEIVQSAEKCRATILSSVCELIQCPVCLNTMYPPIHQCFNGHMLCPDCKVKLHSKCPTCGCQLGGIRCLTLEKVAASIELSCKYKKFGCSGIFPYCIILEHESKCSFRPYFNCPLQYSKCSFVGDIPSLVSHLNDYHKALEDNATNFNYTYVKRTKCEVKNAKWKPMVIRCYGQYFHLHFEAFQHGAMPICIAFVQLIGNDDEARKYSYSLEFEGNGRKTKWQAVPGSIRDSHCEIRDSLNGLIIPQKFFSREESGDGKKLKLKVDGRIWKENFLSDGGSGVAETPKLRVIESCSRMKWYSKVLKFMDQGYL